MFVFFLSDIYSISFNASTISKFLILLENIKLTTIEIVNVMIADKRIFPQVNDGI
jgi:hypothetical protein